MSDDDKTPREPRDWRDTEVPSIPADDPIFREGLIVTFPIKLRGAKRVTEPRADTPPDDREAP